MSLKFVALYPSHLDLNGDQANLKVLAKRLAWRGLQAEIVALQKGMDIPADADLIFIGHGSMAAWQDIKTDIQRLLPSIKKHLDAGKAFMAVASGYELSFELGLFAGSLEPRPRVSKFEIADLNGTQVLGYLNSASNSPVIEKHGLTLGTQLHGPVFAKNPELADAYLAEMLKRKNISWPEKAVNEKADQAVGLIKEIVAQVWKLENELSRE